MRYGSICSGIEAASIAWEPLGWEPAFFSEIAEFPRAVLKHRWPGVPLHDDFTTIKGDEYGSIDLLVGGTPCQDFSIAGKRAGMDGERGNLTREFVELAGRIRPRWLVWENVPGVLSSNRGRDFGAFVGALGELGYSCAWRVLDAQYFGVPQRRRRVFLVANLRACNPASVLFERESLSGNIAKSRQKKSDIANTLRAQPHSSHRADSDNFVPVYRKVTFGQYTKDSKASTLKSRDGKDATDLIAFDCKASGQQGFGVGHISPTLRAMNGQKMNGGGQVALATESSVRRITPMECERLQGFADNHTLIPWVRTRKVPEDEALYIKSMKAPDIKVYKHDNKWFTNAAPDGHRYKAIGNSKAVPVVRWIGQRIEIVEEILKTRREHNQ